MVQALGAAPVAYAAAMPPGLTLAGVGLVAAATVAGAWLALRRPGHQQIWFAAAAGALLIIAGLHLLPDAWAGARAARIWPALVPIAALGGFAAAGLAVRAGCGCQEHKERASGAGTAAALAAHRFLEGSAIALARAGGRGGTGRARVRGRPGHRGAARRPGAPRGALAGRHVRQPPSSAPSPQARSPVRRPPSRCCSPWRPG